jgi:hypothetical protein
VAVLISVRDAPLGRRISSRILEPLLSARGVAACLARASLVAFLLALGSFFGVAAWDLSLAVFGPLGATPLWRPVALAQISPALSCSNEQVSTSRLLEADVHVRGC